MEADTRTKYEALDLPGFFIPSNTELRRRSTLDRYLSQALNIPLTENEQGVMTLPCIDENNFVLTIDFTVKLLCVHERVSCKIPCVIEGETGVSKTALTKMYSILKNSSIHSDADKSTTRDLKYMESKLVESGVSFASCSSDVSPPHERLREFGCESFRRNDG